ncbi:MAG: glycoside hydrolase family 88 protein [Bacteroidaceae bacterium]|nr:glycoside hydrolase family 88 protein [Bacteroidaceae bacterium]
MLSRILPFILLFTSTLAHGQTSLLQDFPEGSTPREVGQRLAYHFVDCKHAFWGGNTKNISYHEVCTWNGAIMYGRAADDAQILQLMRDRFEPFFTTESEFLPLKNHVDLNMFGSLPLMLYQVYDDPRYREMGLSYADTQWELPANAKESQKRLARMGYTWQTRMWIDDMYMITIVQAWAYRVTGDRRYIDRAALEMVKYLDELQRPNGLFLHAPDAPFYWGRGNGWMAVGLTEVLQALPKDSPHYKRILKGYRRLMRSLLKCRNAEGLWNQLVDQPDFWTETSGSGMFTYAFIRGVREGWLPARQYAPAARQAWLALTSYINEKGDVREVCVGTNKKNDFDYYLDRPRVTGDYHGQAPILWCAAALLEK